MPVATPAPWVAIIVWLLRASGSPRVDISRELPLDSHELSEELTSVDTVDGQPDFNTAESAVCRNDFEDATDSDGIVTFEVESGGRALVIEFDTYDIDYAGEVAVF